MRSSLDSGGFSLLDLVLALAILGVLILIAAPGLNSLLQESRITAATTEVVSGLEYAGVLAVFHQRPFGLVVHGSRQSFSVCDYRYLDEGPMHLDAVPPVGHKGVVLNPIDKKWYVRDFQALTECGDARLTEVPPGRALWFYPDGHVGSSNQVIVVRAASSQRTITVNGMTGRVSVN